MSEWPWANDGNNTGALAPKIATKIAAYTYAFLVKEPRRRGNAKPNCRSPQRYVRLEYMPPYIAGCSNAILPEIDRANKGFTTTA